MEDKVESVIKKIILENPVITSRALSQEVGISYEELKEVYQHIKGRLPRLPKKPFGGSKVLLRIMESDVLSDRDRLKKFKREEFIFPDTLELHLGPACQCACRFCWRWSNGQSKKGDLGLYRKKESRSLCKSEKDKTFVPEKLMDDPFLLQIKDVESLLHEFKDNGGKQLYLSGGLEFFTSKIGEDAVKIAANIGIEKIKVYTNGVADCFDKKDFVDLILNKIESIRFSIHAVKSETYAKVQMPHQDKEVAKREFDKVRERIKKMIERRKKCKGPSKKSKVNIAFLVIGDNLYELKEAINWAKKVGIDDFDIRVDMREKEKWFTKKQEDDLKRIVDEIRINNEKGLYSPIEVNARIEASGEKIKYQLPEKCWIPFKKPVVDPWGYVYPCCYRAHPSLQRSIHELGKFPEDTLGNILKKLHNERNFPLTHCAQCTDWELMYNKCIEKVLIDWNDGFLPEDLPFL